MPLEGRLLLLCATLLTTLGACGRITHDIGQIRSENQESDGGDTSSAGDALAADDRSDEETGNAGEEGLLRDAESDGSRLESGLAVDAGEANQAEDGDVLKSDASDALISECIEGGFEVQVAPSGLDIYIMTDAFLLIANMGSAFTPQELEAWTDIEPEISAFVEDPDSQGIGAGIKFYGQPDNLLTPISCDAETYEQPKVEIAELPDNAEAIEGSFPRTPISNSPTAPALKGAINHAKSRVQTHSGRKQVVFLITGSVGLMSDPICNSTRENIEKIAAEGYAESIATYVIGAHFIYDKQFLSDYLSEVAIYGGTSEPHIASMSRVNPELAQQLEEARDEATRSACEISLLDQTGLPGAIDPDRASIVVTTTDDETIILPAVRDHSSCIQSETGWHFDDPSNPSSLIACEQTCAFLGSKSISHAELRLICPN